VKRLLYSASAKGIGVAVIFCALYWGVISPFNLLDFPTHRTQDLVFKLRHVLNKPPAVAKDILLITIDDASIEKVHQKWPFKRRLYAKLIEAAHDGGARLIAMDLVFFGQGDPADNFLLSLAIERMQKVVLAAFIDSDGRFIRSRNEFIEPALDSGLVNKTRDPDGRVRRNRILYRDTEGYIVGWPWEIVIASDIKQFETEGYVPTAKAIHFPSAHGGEAYSLPLSGKLNTAIINYRVNYDDIEQMPFWKFLELENIEEHVKDKILLVGPTAETLQDLHQTPLGRMPGVLINCNFLLNLLGEDFMLAVPLFVTMIMVALFTFFGIYLAFRLDLLRGMLIFAGVSVGVLATAAGLFQANFLMDFFSPLFLGWLAYIIIVLYRYVLTFIENVHLRGEVVTDALTKLYNRRFMETAIEEQIERLRLIDNKKGRSTDVYPELSLIMMDVDNFKKINDTYGHQFGDDVLRLLGTTLKENTRKEDVCARYGGEEFCVILSSADPDMALQIAEKIRKAVEDRDMKHETLIVKFTISIGLVSVIADGLLKPTITSRTVIEAADGALYRAKKTGKNKVFLYRDVKAETAS